MNEDIIKMAREAGFSHDPKTGHVVAVDGFTEVTVTPGLARFAALVRADEREACAKVCDDKAKETFSGQCQVWGDYFARAIRARSKA